MSITVTEYSREDNKRKELVINSINLKDEEFFKDNNVSITVERLPSVARAAVWGQLPDGQTEYVVFMFNKNIQQSLSDLRDMLEKVIKYTERKRS
jgi:hypothetical protein